MSPLSFLTTAASAAGLGTCSVTSFNLTASSKSHLQIEPCGLGVWYVNRGYSAVHRQYSRAGKTGVTLYQLLVAMAIHLTKTTKGGRVNSGLQSEGALRGGGDALWAGSVTLHPWSGCRG